ncbi:TPA: hypothetical protein ACNU9R_005246 [Citrobacter freundii]
MMTTDFGIEQACSLVEVRCERKADITHLTEVQAILQDLTLS